MVYLLGGEGERPEPEAVAATLAATEGVELVCRMQGADRTALRRDAPGMPAAGDEWAVVERGAEQVRFRPARGAADGVADLRRGRRQVEGELGVLAARVEDGRLRSEEYPDPLARVFEALAAPHSGDFVVSLAEGFEAVDWGGTSHAGGGSHGGLGAGDSLGPLLFVGCGPAAAAEQEQWTLRDVAPVVYRHFGLG